MVAKGMIFDPDHMSAKAQLEGLRADRERHRPGRARQGQEAGRPAIKPSVMSQPQLGPTRSGYQRIFRPRRRRVAVRERADPLRQRLGQAAPLRGQAGLPRLRLRHGLRRRHQRLGGQPPARKEPKKSLRYSAEGFPAPIGGIRLKQHRAGLRTFDITKEGVAMYGLFADWFQEVALAADELAPKTGGGKQLTADMLDGAETYLQMWERAVYGVNDCVTDQSRLDVEDLHAALGLNLEGFLDAIGQPADRTDDAYVYCAQDEDGRTVPVEVLFDQAGTATAVRPSDSVLPAATPVLAPELPQRAPDAHDAAGAHAH
jgi:hypothetical protein